jgi:hypothetical protein
MIQLGILKGQEKHLDGLVFGLKLSASERSLEFEKFQISFSDTKTASNRQYTRATPSGC